MPDATAAPFVRTWSPRPELADYVACLWAQRSSHPQRLLPDAAVELVWSGRGLFVRGSDTVSHAVSVFPDQTFVGVRFRVGAAAGVLGLGGRELADARIGISALWGPGEMERLEALLAAARGPRDAADVLEDAVAARVRGRPDAAVAAAAAMLDRGAPVRVAALAARLGLSERQLLRRCVAALGYGPKTLDRILRFQRFRGLARQGGHGLVELALRAGYADQAHLTRDSVRLAGVPPSVLVRDVRFVQDEPRPSPYSR